MLTKIWDNWKIIRDTDPVKARLIRVLTIFGVVVTPFLSVWIYGGFAKAAGMVFALAVTGIGLLAVTAVINWLFGWAAHYVFTGKMPDIDDIWEATILDEWENYQRKQAKAAQQNKPNVTTSMHIPPEAQNNQKPIPDPNTANDVGPDWLRRP